ncbi:MAG TPA: cation:proton antiporter [Burkholderiales bacterium]|nr:cation:proton antiporter [Burkholderiales bacterium]
MNGLTEVLKLLVLAAIALAVLRRLKLPPIVSYVLLGAAAGPHALGWIGESGTIHLLGELGVAFLLFTLGLEFSIAELVAMRRIVLLLGGAQVVLGTLSGAAVAWLLGIDPAGAIVVGGALSMSSTAIVIKQLRDQLELQTAHGRLAIGILLFQDIAAIPFLVVIPILAQSGGGGLGMALVIALGKALAVGAVMLVLGRYALRPILHEAARSRELFTLTALLLSLAAAWTTATVGLSLALGAFLAGMLLSGSEFRHQIDDEIRPFRDVLLGLFFMVIGMQLQPAALPPAAARIALLVVAIVIGKAALVTLLARVYGYRMPEAARTGLTVAQGGEFSVALLALALGTGLVGLEASQPVLAAIVISMLMAPLVIGRSGAVLARVFRSDAAAPAPDEAHLAHATAGMRDHVVVCGYGRVGRQLVRLLEDHGIACVAIDNDPERVKRGWDEGERVYYGDAARRGVLEAAGLRQARAVVVSFDHLNASLRVLSEARRADAKLPVLARAADEACLEALVNAGATEVVPEAMEASLMLATQLLLVLGTPAEQVLADLDAVRSQRYQLLRRPADRRG